MLTKFLGNIGKSIQDAIAPVPSWPYERVKVASQCAHKETLVGATCAAFDAFNRILAVGNKSGTVLLFGADFVHVAQLETKGSVSHLVFAPAKHKLVVVFDKRFCEVFNLVTRTSMCVREFPEAICSVAALVVVPVVLCGTVTGKCLCLNLVDDVFVSSYAVLPDQAFQLKRRDELNVICIDPEDENNILLGFKASGLLVEWSLRDAKEVARFQGQSPLRAAAYKRDSKLIVAGFEDGSVHIFNRKEPGKVMKSYFGGGSQRPVRSLEWSERDKNNIILAAASTPVNGTMEGVTVLSGSPLSRATVIAAATPISSFFLDPSPHLSDTEPGAFCILTERGKIMAFDTANLKPVALPPWFGPSRTEQIDMICCVEVPSDLTRDMSFDYVRSWSALGGAADAQAAAAARAAQSETTLVFKVLDEGSVLVTRAEQPGSHRIDSYRAGRTAEEIALPPCIGCASSISSDKVVSLALWSAMELVVMVHDRTIPGKVSYAGRDEQGSFTIETKEEVTQDAQEQEQHQQQQESLPSPEPATSSPVNRRPVTPPVVAALNESSEAAIVEKSIEDDFVVVDKDSGAEGREEGAETGEESSAAPESSSSSSAVPKQVVAPKVSEAIEREPSWTTALHIAGCGEIRSFQAFDDLYVVAFGERSVGVWRRDDDSGVVSEVGVFELPSMDEDDFVLSVTVFRDAAILVHEGEDPVFLVKVLACSFKKSAWLLELHDRAVRVHPLLQPKRDAGSLSDEILFSSMVVGDGGQLQGLVDSEANRFHVSVEKRRVSIRRMLVKPDRVLFEECAIYELEPGSYVADAGIVPNVSKGYACLGCIIHKDAYVKPEVLLLPLVDVSKGPLLRVPLYGADRMVQIGTPKLVLMGRSVVCATEFGELLTFHLHVISSEDASSEAGEEQGKEQMAATAAEPRLWNPNAKLKEKPRAGGFLAGIFAHDNRELAQLFSDRLEGGGDKVRAATATASTPKRKVSLSPRRRGSSPGVAASPGSSGGGANSPSGRASPAAANQVGEVKNIMEENKRKLMERGEAVAELDDKASELESQSTDFLRNIQKLKEKQKKSWF